jgi:hypothetical protein
MPQFLLTSLITLINFFHVNFIISLTIMVTEVFLNSLVCPLCSLLVASFSCLIFIIWIEISATVLLGCFKIGGNGTYIVNIAMLGLLEPSELLCADMLFYAWVLKDKHVGDSSLRILEIISWFVGCKIHYFLDHKMHLGCRGWMYWKHSFIMFGLSDVEF